MKKWFKYFCLSFFSHKTSKEGARRSYGNLFLGFIISLVLLWAGFVLGDMLPFGAHYNGSPDFKATVHSVLANADAEKRIVLEIENGTLKAKKQGGEYSQSLMVNTLENDADRQNYSKNGYNIVVDMRPANTPAEVEAYCVSSDGDNLEITYEDYLTLSEVKRLNFDFKLRYTGRALELSDESVVAYRAYLDGSDEGREMAEKLEGDLSENKITRDEYNRAIYETYFESYYPEITAYENTSKVPLLRNYYYHQYISCGIKNYLFIFDDYMTGSFETRGGNEISFHGFYGDLEDGCLVTEGAATEEAERQADSFIKKSFSAIVALNAYGYLLKVLSLVPFIALMIMVAALLTYSILKLRGVESISSLGATLKIVGSYVWPSGVISCVMTVIISFFVSRSMINALPQVLLFTALAVRSVIFALQESGLYAKSLELQEATETEV